MNELWYDDLPLKSEETKILPIKIEYVKGGHFKNEVSIFLLNLKGRDTTKAEKQEIKGRSPPCKTIKQIRFIQP